MEMLDNNIAESFYIANDIPKKQRELNSEWKPFIEEYNRRLYDLQITIKDICK